MLVLFEAIKGRSLLICFILAAIGMVYWWLKFQKELNIRVGTAIFLAVAHVVLAIVTTKLWAILEVGGDLERAVSMRLYGALFLMPPMYFLWAKATKRNVSLVMDASCICCAVGLVFVRLNCIKQGCCDGICIYPGSEIHWPLREIELAYCFGFLIYFIIQISKRRSKGLVTPKMYITYGVLRFIMEWVRDEYTGSFGVFHLAHIWSLIAIAVGAVMYYKVRKNIRPGEARRNDTKSKHLAKGGK